MNDGPVDGRGEKMGGKKKEGNEDFLKASGIYNWPNEVDFEGRSSNGKLESHCEESKEVWVLWRPAISDRGRSLRILFSAADICTAARNDAEQVFTGSQPSYIFYFTFIVFTFQHSPFHNK
jgi:hypothetical protein